MADNFNSQYTGELKCYTHGHFSLIFDNIVILTNSSTLISKVIVSKLKSCLKMVFWDVSL